MKSAAKGEQIKERERMREKERRAMEKETK
jgi:hypothetical protein